MGGGDSITSKVIEDEEDLRSDGCRRGRGEEVGNSSVLIGWEQQKKCPYVSGDWQRGQLLCRCCGSFQHDCFRGEDVCSIFDGPWVEPSWSAVVIMYIVCRVAMRCLVGISGKKGLFV